MTFDQFAEEVRIVKLQLSELRDPDIKDLLPGAERVAIGACDLLDELLAELRKQQEPRGSAEVRSGYHMGRDGFAHTSHE